MANIIIGTSDELGKSQCMDNTLSEAKFYEVVNLLLSAS